MSSGPTNLVSRWAAPSLFQDSRRNWLVCSSLAPPCHSWRQKWHFLSFSLQVPHHHVWSNIIESGLAMTSASSFSASGCIPSWPMDLCMCSLLNYSLTWSSSTKGTSSLLHPAFCHVLWNLGFLNQIRCIYVNSFRLLSWLRIADLMDKLGTAF